jgi:hypothetical protein
MRDRGGLESRVGQPGSGLHLYCRVAFAVENTWNGKGDGLNLVPRLNSSVPTVLTAGGEFGFELSYRRCT